MHARKGQPHQMDPSRQRQRTLYQAAQQRRHRRCQARDDRSCRPAMLWRAWRDVRAHGGHAGVDGVWRDDVEPQGVAAFLQALEPDRRAGSARPQPVRRGSSPTPARRPRPRGMPTGRDRVVPQACTLVLEPLCEANVHTTSDGVRPRRRVTPAVQVVTASRVSHGSVGAGDRAGGFDTRDQVRLRRCVARRSSDRRVLKRRRQWLQAGVVDEGQ
jgi:RNA-directed DNA polymerase